MSSSSLTPKGVHAKPTMMPPEKATCYLFACLPEAAHADRCQRATQYADSDASSYVFTPRPLFWASALALQTLVLWWKAPHCTSHSPSWLPVKGDAWGQIGTSARRTMLGYVRPAAQRWRVQRYLLRLCEDQVLHDAFWKGIYGMEDSR